jgi:hypothetical protein
METTAPACVGGPVAEELPHVRRAFGFDMLRRVVIHDGLSRHDDGPLPPGPWPMGTDLPGAASVRFTLGPSDGKGEQPQCDRSHKCSAREAPMAREVLLSGCPERGLSSRSRMPDAGCPPRRGNAAVCKRLDDPL